MPAKETGPAFGPIAYGDFPHFGQAIVKANNACRPNPKIKMGMPILKAVRLDTANIKRNELRIRMIGSDRTKP